MTIANISNRAIRQNNLPHLYPSYLVNPSHPYPKSSAIILSPIMRFQLSIPSPEEPTFWASRGPLHLGLVTHIYRKNRVLTISVLRLAHIPQPITLHAHIPLSSARPTQNVRAGLQTYATTKRLSHKTNFATLSLPLPPHSNKLNIAVNLDQIVELPRPASSSVTHIRETEEMPPFTLATLLREPEFTDVTLRVGDPAQLIHAHAAVLALSSPVFRTMLLTDMAERRTRIVQLAEFSAKVVEITLRFIYGENMCVPESVAMEVYRFAHLYDIQTLLTAARETLKGLAKGKRDAVTLLQFACLYEDGVLRETARGIIAKEFGSLLQMTEVREIPTEAFYELLESDDIWGMEIDVLQVGLKWIADRGEEYMEGVLRRVRWGLMDDGILESGKKLVANIAPRLADRVKKVQSVSRVFGKPACTIFVPVVRVPPRVKAAAHRCAEDVESSFEWKGLHWRMRVGVAWCAGCKVPQVDCSFWLQEEEDGGVRMAGRKVLPLRVAARCAVWAGGMYLGSRKFAVEFAKGGWACGWGVRDLIEREEWRSDVVTVSLEILEIETP